MPRKTLAKFIYENLLKASWPGVAMDEVKQVVHCPKGQILILIKGEYHLKFYWYSSEKKEYNLRESYSEIVFPKTFDIRKLIFFRRNGNYKLAYEHQFKSITNPLNKNVNKIKLNTSSRLKFHKQNIILPLRLFSKSMKDAKYVYDKSTSYKNSTQNYLSGIKSHDYSNNVKKRTTYMEKGEFHFLVDRLYLKTKDSKKDFHKYLDEGDLKSMEELMTELLKYDVLSEEYLRRLSDYFIKVRLKDIIELGKEILSLKSTDLTTTVARKTIEKMELVGVSQLETLWQKYFEKNLLYLIFTYKKIFPKVELKDIEGEKKYPDFIGINHYNGLDIIEIKTHLKNVLVWDNSHQNFYFSPEMSKAIVQTKNYMDAIMQERFKIAEDRENITKFTDEENLYHPRGIIIISSRNKLTTNTGQKEKLKRDFTKLRNSVHDIEILTFDEIINIADEYIKNIIPDVRNGR